MQYAFNVKKKHYPASKLTYRVMPPSQIISACIANDLFVFSIRQEYIIISHTSILAVTHGSLIKELTYERIPKP